MVDVRKHTSRDLNSILDSPDDGKVVRLNRRQSTEFLQKIVRRGKASTMAPYEKEAMATFIAEVRQLNPNKRARSAMDSWIVPNDLHPENATLGVRPQPSKRPMHALALLIGEVKHSRPNAGIRSLIETWLEQYNLDISHSRSIKLHPSALIQGPRPR